MLSTTTKTPVYDFSKRELIDKIMFLSYTYRIPSPNVKDLLNTDNERLELILEEVRKHLPYGVVG